MERLVNRSLLTILATFLLAAVVAPDFARADDVVEKVVVRNRKYRAESKFELNPSVGFSLTNRLTDHVNFQLGLAYNFSETLALELRPGFAVSGLTSVAEEARTSVYQKKNPWDVNNVGRGLDDFQDLWRLEWQALLLPRWTPIYGKLNLVTELPIHFQAYLTAGGGAVGLKRESLVYCQNGVSAPATPGESPSGRNGDQCGGAYLDESKATYAIAGGGGMRFFINENYLLKLEMFDIAYPDEYRAGVVRSEAETEAPGSEAKTGTVKNGFTNVLFFNLGASVVF